MVAVASATVYAIFAVVGPVPCRTSHQVVAAAAVADTTEVRVAHIVDRMFLMPAADAEHFVEDIPLKRKRLMMAAQLGRLGVRYRRANLNCF